MLQGSNMVKIARAISGAKADADRQYVIDSQKRLPALLLSLPYLRAAWTMGGIDFQNPQVLDLTGAGYRLTNNAVSLFGDEDSAPFAQFDGAAQYLSRPDGGVGNWADILGTEGYIPAAQRGLTVGGFFKFDRLTNSEFLIGKATTVAATSSYWLIFRGDLAGDPVRFVISNGAANTTVSHTPADAPATGRWYYAVGRFSPGAETKVYWGAGRALESSTNVAAIPAALNDSAADFTIGASSGGAAFLDGYASCGFLCAGQLSDQWVRCLYSQLRSIFRV